MDYSIKKTDEFPIPTFRIRSVESNQFPEKVSATFSCMCGRLARSIVQQKIIYERALLDFNRFVIWIVNNQVTAFPDTFFDLTNRLSDYWHYELDREENPDRAYSYIRLYQMVDTIQTFQQDLEMQKTAEQDLARNRENLSILLQIGLRPGITLKELRKNFKDLSEDDFRNQLKALDENGFLSGRHSGDFRFFVLTSKGDALYRMAISKNQPYHRWNHTRVKLLWNLLEIYLEQDNELIDIPVKMLVERILSLDDQVVEKLLSGILERKIQSMRERMDYDKRLYRETGMNFPTLSSGIDRIILRRFNQKHIDFSFKEYAELESLNIYENEA